MILSAIGSSVGHWASILSVQEGLSFEWMLQNIISSKYGVIQSWNLALHNPTST